MRTTDRITESEWRESKNSKCGQKKSKKRYKEDRRKRQGRRKYRTERGMKTVRRMKEGVEREEEVSTYIKEEGKNKGDTYEWREKIERRGKIITRRGIKGRDLR